MKTIIAGSDLLEFVLPTCGELEVNGKASLMENAIQHEPPDYFCER